MTSTRGFVLCVTVAAAGVLLHADPRPADPGASATARLKGITARVGGKGTSIVIEATEPVAYVASRPNALTVLVDLRNVAPESVSNSVAAATKGPIAAVTVEPVDPSSVGVQPDAPSSRVRIALAQPVAHHVRSDRNAIIIDFDRASTKGAPAVTLPSVDPFDALGLDPVRAGLGAPRSIEPAPAALLQQTASIGPRSGASAGPAQTPAAPAPQAPGTSEVVANTAQKKYGGHPISMDFQDLDLRSVLRVFAEESGLNMVLDPAVQGTVNVQLRDVPWDQALDMILRANKLGYIVDGTIVRIAPLTVLAEEETQRRKLTEEQALAGQLQVLTKTLSYAKAEDMQALLTKSALSQRGTVQIDPRTNTLIITDLPDRLQTASELVGTLDRAQPQVEIEARIVQVNKNYQRALGVQWGVQGAATAANGNTTPLAFPNSITVAGQGSGSTTAAPAGTVVNLPVSGAPTAIGIALGSINGAFNLDAALSALESSGNGKLLSTPKVTTLNNVTAEMKQGVEIPIQVVANNTVTVQFKDAALDLKVTPQITSVNTIIMQVVVENASPDFSRTVNNIPPINTQTATTTVLVNDGNTTVIGGVYVSNEQTQSDRTPAVSRLPLLGWLFRRDSVNDTSTELLVFITPHIVKG